MSNRQKSVVRVESAGQRSASALRRHPVGVRGHDQPVQRLELPAAAHELGGEPVEQLGMRRQLAELAEVVRERTSPRPKWYCQSRLAITRAVSGFFASVSHGRQCGPLARRLRSRRRRLRQRLQSGGRQHLGHAGASTSSPFTCGRPRSRTCVGLLPRSPTRHHVDARRRDRFPAAASSRFDQLDVALRRRPSPRTLVAVLADEVFERLEPSARRTSIYCPPPVCLQCTASVFSPDLQQLASLPAAASTRSYLVRNALRPRRPSCR